MVRKNGKEKSTLAVKFRPLNAEIPLPDALTPEGEALRDEIVDEVAKSLLGFSAGRRWPEGQ